MTELYWTLPLGIQVALGGGYIAQHIAFSGLRKTPSALEITMRSVAFGVIALVTFGALQSVISKDWINAIAAVSAAILGGALWRIAGMPAALWLMKTLRLSPEDGIPDAWTALIQTNKLNVTQMSVHTTDGRILYHDRTAYGAAWKDGLYFGSDGSIIMVVAEEDLPDGTSETREGVDVPEWGVRLTYIPANQIARINLRTPTIS